MHLPVCSAKPSTAPVLSFGKCNGQYMVALDEHACAGGQRLHRLQATLQPAARPGLGRSSPIDPLCTPWNNIGMLLPAVFGAALFTHLDNTVHRLRCHRVYPNTSSTSRGTNHTNSARLLSDTK